MVRTNPPNHGLPQLEHEREIRQLYHERNARNFDTPAPKFNHHIYWGGELAMVVIFAIISSAAASIIVFSLLQPMSPLVERTVRTVTSGGPELKDDFVQRYSGSVALVFVSRTPRSTEATEQAYLVSEALGHALVLSSDGWLVTTQLVVPDTKRSYVVAAGGNIRAVTKVVLDPVVPLAYLKVEATNLSATAFAESHKLVLGQELVVVAQASQMAKRAWYWRSLASVEARSVVARADLVTSSEQFVDRYLLDRDVPSGSQGAPVLTTQGEVVGLVAEYGGGLRAVVPLDNVGATIDSIFSEGVVRRPALGVSYLQSSWVTPYGLSSVASGAIITASVKRPAITPKSAAATAGLKENDVITFLAGDKVAGRSLTSMLQQYRPGAKLELTLERGGKTVTVTVTLDEVTAGLAKAQP